MVCGFDGGAGTDVLDMSNLATVDMASGPAFSGIEELGMAGGAGTQLSLSGAAFERTGGLSSPLTVKGDAEDTLVLWGGRDRLIPPDNGERLHRDIAGSQLVVFPALGHVPQEEDPARSVAPVKTFLGLR